VRPTGAVGPAPLVAGLAVLAPLALGLTMLALTSLKIVPDPQVTLTADLSAVTLLIGVVLSLSVAAALVIRRRVARLQHAALERLREQASEDRRRFFGRLDHELKNPLTAIHAGVANLAEAPGAEAPGAEARAQALGSLAAQTVRLSRLAADLRKLADLETLEIERAPVDLAALLRDVLALAQEHPRAEGRQLTLTLPRAPWPLPGVSGDYDLLFLALHNLLDNAIKFSRPADTVEMRAFEDGSTVVVEVADTGPGIVPAEVDHVWEELFRGQAARAVPGSGLGLALVRAILARHRGQVGLRSRLGQGTVVTVRLPAG